jgi:hypothetical protein
VTDEDTSLFIVVREGAGHRVVAPLVGDSLAELEERAIAAVDRAIDAHVARAGFTGRITVAFRELPDCDEEVERARIQAILQERADAFGGVTVFGKPLRVAVTIGLEGERDEPPAVAREPTPPAPVLQPVAGGGPFDAYFQEGFVVRDESQSEALVAKKVITVIVATVAAAVVFTMEPTPLTAVAIVVAFTIIVAIVWRGGARHLRLYRDRLEIVERRTRVIRFADVETFMFRTTPIPGRYITKKEILVRYDPPRGGEILGSDDRYYDEVIGGDFVPIGTMALVVILNFRLQRFREASP